MNGLGHFRFGALGLLVSLIAIGFIALQINIDRLASALLNADYQFLLPGAALLLLGLFTRAMRWRVLLASQLPLRRAFNIMNIAYLVNGVLPLRLGEVARIYLTARVKEAIPPMQTASTIVVERLLDLLAVVVMAALALTAAAASTALQTAAMLGAALAIGGFAILFVLAYQRQFTQALVRRLTAKAALLRRLRLDQLASDFFDGLMPMRDLRSLALAIFWTGISWALSAAANYIFLFAFFDRGDWTAGILSVAMAAFAIALPMAPASIGAYEASILGALILLGYEHEAAIAFAVAVHAINILFNAVTGIFGLAQEGISLSQLQSGARQMKRRSAS